MESYPDSVLVLRHRPCHSSHCSASDVAQWNAATVSPSSGSLDSASALRFHYYSSDNGTTQVLSIAGDRPTAAEEYWCVAKNGMEEEVQSSAVTLMPPQKSASAIIVAIVVTVIILVILMAVLAVKMYKDRVTTRALIQIGFVVVE